MDAMRPLGPFASAVDDTSLIHSLLRLLAASEQKVHDCARRVRDGLPVERRAHEAAAVGDLVVHTRALLNEIVAVGQVRFGGNWRGCEAAHPAKQPERELWLALASGQSLRRVLFKLAERTEDPLLQNDVRRWLGSRALLIEALERAHACADASQGHGPA